MFRRACALLPVVACCLVSAARGGTSNSLLDVSPDGTRLLVVNSDSGTVSIVDTKDRKVLHEIKVGDKPEGGTWIQESIIGGFMREAGNERPKTKEQKKTDQSSPEQDDDWPFPNRAFARRMSAFCSWWRPIGFRLLHGSDFSLLLHTRAAYDIGAGQPKLGSTDS